MAARPGASRGVVEEEEVVVAVVWESVEDRLRSSAHRLKRRPSGMRWRRAGERAVLCEDGGG
jgi:hypothetical protein